jgi:hypothetical protein
MLYLNPISLITVLCIHQIKFFNETGVLCISTHFLLFFYAFSPSSRALIITLFAKLAKYGIVLLMSTIKLIYNLVLCKKINRLNTSNIE